MIIYDRPDEDVFAEGAKPGEVADFPNVARGWGEAFDRTGGKPPMEWFNWLGIRTDRAMRYFLQRGVSEWSQTDDYPEGAIVQFDGVLYQAIQRTSGDRPDDISAPWGPLYNYGVTSITGLTGGNVTLQPRQAAKNRIVLSGLLTGNVQIILPTWLKDWKINNNTTGDFTVTCRTAAGLGAICLPGLTTTIYGDGTNINLDSPALGGASIAGNGYQELPGGLIMQWLTGASDSNGILTRPWPIPFPNALFGATATYLSNGTALAAVIPSVSNISTAMTCVVNVANSAGGAVASANVKVIALGN